MNAPKLSGAESRRLTDARQRGVPWRKWGPYLSERQWGTVREDYSENGDYGAGIGASHQTGWTGLVARLIQLFGRMDGGRFLELGRAAAFAKA